MIILPRQARDKHRENSKKRAFFCAEVDFTYPSERQKQVHL